MARWTWLNSIKQLGRGGRKDSNHSLQECTEKNPQRTNKCISGSPKATCHCRPEGCLRAISLGVFCVLILLPQGAGCWPQSEAGCWASWVLLWLDRDGFLCSYDSKQPQRVKATVIQSCFISGRQIWRNHWAGIGKDLHHVAGSPRYDPKQAVSMQGHLPGVI